MLSSSNNGPSGPPTPSPEARARRSRALPVDAETGGRAARGSSPADPAALVDIAAEGRGRTGVSGVGVAGFRLPRAGGPAAGRHALASRLILGGAAGAAAGSVRPAAEPRRGASGLGGGHRAVLTENRTHHAARCRRAARQLLALRRPIAITGRHAGTNVRVAAERGDREDRQRRRPHRPNPHGQEFRMDSPGFSGR